MNAEERRIIEDLFDKLEAVGRNSGPPDPEAEALIERRLMGQSGAAYRMAQTIVVQERALEAAQARLAEVEQRAAPAQGQGGFLEGLWGGPKRDARGSAPMSSGASGPWGTSGGSRQGGYGTGYGQSRGGGGFLAGAAQTAMGVAGGVVLGSFLADALTPDAAFAGDGEGSDPGSDYEGGGEPSEDLAGDGGDFGGDFGGE